MMDDFFRDTVGGGRTGHLTLAELAYLRSHSDIEGRKLDLWTVVYESDLKFDIAEYLFNVDLISYWTWRPKDLEGLEDSFARLETIVPRGRKTLGCYMWDYDAGKPIPLSLMQKQCELGLKWLRMGRIEGMIFLGSGTCDLGLEAVEWTRSWIREVGDEKI
jgi:hypothetical protein